MKKLTLGILAIAFASILVAPAAQADAAVGIKIQTDLGDIHVALNPNASPRNVAAFEKYMKAKVYEHSCFHSVGDKYIFGGKPGPEAVGYSGSGNMASATAPAGEFTLKNTKGALTMGRTAGDCNPQMRSNSTQFVIHFEDQHEDDGRYTVIGYVSQGMDVVERIAKALKTPDQTKPTVLIKDISLEAR